MTILKQFTNCFGLPGNTTYIDRLQDWDPYVYIDGGVIILKKQAWEKAKWDENIFWKEILPILIRQNQHQLSLLFSLYFQGCT